MEIAGSSRAAGPASADDPTAAIEGPEPSLSSRVPPERPVRVTSTRDSMMAPHTDDDTDTQERANDLYWASDESVNSIAEGLGLSKGALYHQVRPLPAGLPCPRCGSEMEYPNRTARDKGFLTCPSCDLEEDEEIVREAWQADGEPGGVVVRPSLGEGAGRRLRALGSGSDRTRLVLAATLLGAAAGMAVALWSRKK